ncbi:MAG: branched-chain amino acid ABC transporter permease [Elainellaceae cyanobacterium]
MEGYIVSLIIFTSIFSLFGLGLNLQWGFTGLINFGHVAFMAVGAYFVALLTLPGYLQKLPTNMLENFTWMQQSEAMSGFLQRIQQVMPEQVPIPIAVLIGAIAAAFLGLLIGLSTLKLREDYLAIVTIGVSEIIRLIALNEEWLTEGAFGVQRFSLPLSNLNPNFFTRIVMIALLTAVLGIALWQLWKHALSRIKTAPSQAIIKGSVILIGYVGSLLLLLYGIGLSAQQLKLSNALPPWLLGISMIAVFAAVCALYIWLSRKFFPKLSALGASSTLVSVIACTVLGVWIYGFLATALYNYSRNPTKTGLMLISLLVLAVIFWALQRLVSSPWGRVLKAIREDEEVAKALGKNVFWYKLQSLMLGGAIAGIAGALYAWQLTTIYPDNFQPLVTFNAWTIVVLGGAGNNVGTLLGAAIFWAYQTLTRFVLADIIPLDDARLGAFRIMIIGLLLMVLMIWRPQGILGKKEELTLGR